MPKKKDKSDHFPVRVGEQLFTALTQWEIARLLDLLFAVLSPEITEKVLEQLLALATDMGVTDLSTRHSWYAHGCIEDAKHGT